MRVCDGLQVGYIFPIVTVITHPGADGLFFSAIQKCFLFTSI